MASAGRNNALKNFTVEQMRERTLDIYRDLIGIKREHG
jgi:hypothetical protein